MASKKDWEFFNNDQIDDLCDFLADDAAHYVLQEVLQSVAIDYSKFAPTEDSIMKHLRTNTFRDMGVKKPQWASKEEWDKNRKRKRLTTRNVKFDIKGAGMKADEKTTVAVAQWVFKKRAGYALSRYIVGARLVQKMRGKSFRHIPKTAWNSKRANMSFEQIRKNSQTMSKQTNDTRLKVKDGEFIEFFTFCKWQNKAYRAGVSRVEGRIDKHRSEAFKKWAKNLAKRKDYQEGFAKWKG